eukprot:2502142-Rhodomonas_salina.1
MSLCPECSRVQSEMMGGAMATTSGVNSFVEVLVNVPAKKALTLARRLNVLPAENQGVKVQTVSTRSLGPKAQK